MNQPNPGSNQSSGGQGGGGQNPRRNNNRRRHHNNNRPQRAEGREAQGNQAPRPEGQHGQGPSQQGGGQRRRHPNRHRHNNQPRRDNQSGNSGQQQGGFNLDRVYEKYLNLLDQHLIARRKYHDLFYRADPAQKAKLEKNFYSTLNDVREFENRLAPDVRDLFEKRNNGLNPDRTYTSNREMPVEGDPVPEDMPIEDPHFLQSQKQADFKEDTEESIGTLDDYLRYKNLH